MEVFIEHVIGGGVFLLSRGVKLLSSIGVYGYTVE